MKFRMFKVLKKNASFSNVSKIVLSSVIAFYSYFPEEILVHCTLQLIFFTQNQEQIT